MTFPARWLGHLYAKSLVLSHERLAGRRWSVLRMAVLLLVDALAVLLAYVGAYWLRFEGWNFGIHAEAFRSALPFIVVVNLSAFVVAGMYRQMWRYATFHSIMVMLRAIVLGILVTLAGCYMIGWYHPRSIYFIFAVLSATLVGASRIGWRAMAVFHLRSMVGNQELCLIYGAGSGGDLLARHIEANPKFPYKAVGFVDDDPTKKRQMIHGLRVLGTGSDLTDIKSAFNVQVAILAFPSAPGKMVREALARCQAAGLKALTMPDMATALGDEVFQPRPVDIRDLLKRSPKDIDQSAISTFFRDKTVLVTGAGGSIGSEICRQVLSYRPRRLLVLDASEFALYQIDEELRPKAQGAELHALLGSITDARFIDSIMAKFTPDCVLHAAAYKHVPLVEINPLQGIYNNLEGTRVLATSAQKHGVSKFLLISSDKAVRPTNIMGATKRCCELLIQTLQSEAKAPTRFCSVRFGNVLGSSGSVIPKFLQQIQAGGPVTVTHPEITRYFMLTSEAVGLVLQSIAMSDGGETFVLDMGEPVRVADMAVQLIQLAGKTPGKDIDVVFTGLRPGEKLYEELILEGVEDRTTHENIFVMRPTAHTPEGTRSDLNRLLDVTREGLTDEALRLVRSLASDPGSRA